MFESTIREALADGIVTEEERENLERLKKQFGMSDEKVQAIERQVREEKNAQKDPSLSQRSS
jgi:uncharacterized membrane protein YebE (DUF533 family)